MNSIKRCLIYAHFNNENIVRKSTIKILQEFKQLTEYIVFVSNSEIMNLEEVKQIVDDIIVRENIGYDVGAYRDVIISEVYEEIEQNYDELILCNSSFWGPFIPLKDLFNVMENRGKDYWGLAFSGKNLVHHVQSYFMVFGKKILQRELLKLYFDRWVSAGELRYEEVCRTFEIGLNDFLLSQGCSYDAYSYKICFDPYSNPYGSIKYDNLPILKKKFFSDKFIRVDQVSTIMELITQKYMYDTSDLLEEIVDIYNINMDDVKGKGSENLLVNAEINQNGRLKEWEEIKRYIDNNDSVYILGCGYMMRQVMNHFFSGDDKEKLAGIIALGKITDLSEEEIARYLRNYIDDPVIVCVDDDEVDYALFHLKIYNNFFFIWKSWDEYKCNTVSYDDTILCAMGKYFYYRTPLVIIDADEKYCGILTKNEMENQYTFSEETTVMAIANTSIIAYKNIEDAKQFIESNVGAVVPIVDEKDRFIKILM